MSSTAPPKAKPTPDSVPAADDQAGAPDLDSPKARQIMDAAGALFFSFGFGSTSMGQIATKAGVSKGTLYNYFADKEALFAAVVRSVCEEHNDQLFALKAGDRDVAAVLHRVAVSFVVFVTGDYPTAGYRVVIAEANRFPHLGEVFYAAGPAAGIKRLADYLDWAAGEGLIAVADATEAARDFLELSKAAVHMRRMLNLRGPVERDEAIALADKTVTKFMAIYAPPA
ncbi:MAG: TetR/AcrR family transcriptional regulator [Pseudomonadota bacterium]